MEKALLTRLDSICARKIELEKSLSDPKIIKNQLKFIEQSKELSELTPITECFEKIKKKQDDIAGAEELLLDSDPNIKKLGEEELVSIKRELNDLETKLKKKGIDFHFFPLSIFFGSSNNKYLNLIYLILSTPTICYLILKYKIDIIHSNDMKIHLNWILPSFLLRKRFIWHQRTIFPNSRISKMLIKLAYAIVSISKFVQKTIHASVCFVKTEEKKKHFSSHSPLFRTWFQQSKRW